MPVLTVCCVMWFLLEMMAVLLSVQFASRLGWRWWDVGRADTRWRCLRCSSVGIDGGGIPVLAIDGFLGKDTSIAGMLGAGLSFL